jgi:hypothetical protein
MKNSYKKYRGSLKQGDSMVLLRHLTILGLLLLSFDSYAQDFSFSVLELRGTGCPKGSHASVVSPDGSSLSILFDRFSALVPNESTNNDNDEVDATEVDPTLKKKNSINISRRACNIILQATIPADQRVMGLDITTDVRGVAMMDLGTEGIFQSLFVGKKGLGHKGAKEAVQVGQRVWRANKADVSEDWVFSKTHQLPLASGCAKKQDRKMQLNLKTVLIAKILPSAKKLTPRGELVIDSSDIAGSLRVKVKTQPCKVQP